MKKCHKCNGYGCPACLGTGSGHARGLVREWGDRNDHAGITPEEIPSLPVTQQREAQAFVQRHLSLIRKSSG